MGWPVQTESNYPSAAAGLDAIMGDKCCHDQADLLKRRHLCSGSSGCDSTSLPPPPALPREASDTKPSESVPASDEVTAPPYYARLAPQPLDVIESWGLGFHLGCVVKYLARAGHKVLDGETKRRAELRDLRKARQYLDRLIRMKESGA